MPIVVNHNINPDHGVINGTYGTVHSIHFAPTTRFRLVRDSGTGMKVLVPSAHPTVVLLRLRRADSFPKIPREHLPESHREDIDLYPVFPIRSRGCTEIELTPSRGGIARTAKLSLVQLPFVAAVASTVYKIQGETLDSIVVADWRATGKGKANTPQQAYIVVSRVKTRNGFFSMRPITASDVAFFRPNTATFMEDRRLGHMFEEFVAQPHIADLFDASDYAQLTASFTATEPSRFQPKKKQRLIDRLRHISATYSSSNVADSIIEHTIDVSDERLPSFKMADIQSTTSLLRDASTSAVIHSSHASNKRIQHTTKKSSKTASLQLTMNAFPTPEVPVSMPHVTWVQPPDIQALFSSRFPAILNLSSLSYFSEMNAWLSEDVMDPYVWLLEIGYHNIVNFPTSMAQYLKDQEPRERPIRRLLAESRMSATNAKLFLFPIHCRNHWILGIINLDEGWYGYYDSYHLRRPSVQNIIKKLLSFLTQQEIHYRRFIAGPKQTNNFDCGLFVLVACRCLAVGAPLHNSFDAIQMPQWRQHIQLELRGKQILPFHPPSH